MQIVQRTRPSLDTIVALQVTSSSITTSTAPHAPRQRHPSSSTAASSCTRPPTQCTPIGQVLLWRPGSDWARTPRTSTSGAPTGANFSSTPPLYLTHAPALCCSGGRPGCSARLACRTTMWGGNLQCWRVRSHGQPAQYQSASGRARRARGCGVSGAACGRWRGLCFGARLCLVRGTTRLTACDFFFRTWATTEERRPIVNGIFTVIMINWLIIIVENFYQSMPFPSATYVRPRARYDGMGIAIHSRRIALNINSLARKSRHPFPEPRLPT